MMHPRARRPFFVDLRFIVGVALVITSVVGVWLLISTSRQTTPVLQAARTVASGETISSADLQVVDVGLGAVTEQYLAPQDLEPGAVATRTLSAGELIPASAVGTGDDLRTTTMVVSSTVLPAGVGTGDPVELWHAPLRDDGRTFDEPRVLVADAVVLSVSESEGMLAGSRTDVELVIDRADVAALLAAVTGGSAISVVPTGSGS